jgi:uncharacterized DUF497 family protein
LRLGRLDFKYDGFDWDEFNSGKVKDRIPLEIAEELFQNEFFARKDERHSLSEERFIGMGEVEGRIIFVSYTMRQKGDETLIRIIGGRYVHTNSKEERIYEEAKKFIKKSNGQLD